MTFGSKKVRGTFLASCPEIKKQEKPPVEVFSLSPRNEKVREGPGDLFSLSLETREQE